MVFYKRDTSCYAPIRRTAAWIGVAVGLGIPGAAVAQSAAGTAPRIIGAYPQVGSTTVDPATTAIMVQFDRDMGGGMSWTGGGPEFPKIPEGAKGYWRDKRTCVLPVHLQPGSSYRVGINAPNFQNFKSAEGIPVIPTALHFTTTGNGGAAVQSAARAPQIVSMSPANGATDVDPALIGIQVTFDTDMAGGMSWTGGGPEFPKIPEGAKGYWRDKRTCILPVQLQPGSSYRVGINAPSFQNFKSVAGVPAPQAVLTFRTRGSAPAGGAKAPQIVSMTPANGATAVDPALSAIQVTFDTPMGSGMSWTGGGSAYPKTPDGQRPGWSADKKTCTLPVKLEANHQYQLGLNSVSFKNFTSEAGVPLEPVVYTFKTR
ncbi:MAG: Ig-like domain-containing protein [Candidatus Sumerlaeaceae bacterium]